MLVNFRQGIIQTQLIPAFLSFIGGYVNINANSGPTIITFAHGSANYLLTENESKTAAWTGPFVSGNDYWLYWDIDIFSGLITYGSTTVNPFTPSGGYGPTLPTTPVTGQHFFDTSVKKMKMWTGNKWVEKIRVFAAKLTGAAFLEFIDIGTQVGINQSITAGHILFDSNGNPVKTADRLGRGYFITTESFLNSQDDTNNSYKLEGHQLLGKAIENIPKFYCVSWKGPKQLGVASSENSLNPCIGISSTDMKLNEVKPFITNGLITNLNNWNFTVPPGTPLWVSPVGEVTLELPRKTSMQKIGHVVSPDTIFVNIDSQILIDPAS